MKTILIIVLVILWVRSYIKFHKRQSYFNSVVECLLNNPRAKNLPNYQLRLGSAYMEAQCYRSAYECFDRYKHSSEYVPSLMAETVEANMAFCKNPIPWMHDPKDLTGSWWHNFLLVRFGKRRRSMLTEEDLLMTNSWIRSRERNGV